MPMSDSWCYCTNLRRAAKAISVFYDTALHDAGLTSAQYYLLINLSRLGSANITHWAETVGLERSTMVRNIKPLQERGLVEMTSGHGKTFVLTPEGKQRLEQAIPLWEKAQKQIEGALGEADAEAIFRISRKASSLGNNRNA